jgi:hypothetical protein
MPVKSLFSDPEAAEPEAPGTPEGPVTADGQEPAGPEVTVERACPHCGAALADDQDWCLECGQSTRERWSGLPGWRTGAAVIAVTLVMASGAVAAAYAALKSGDSDDTPATTQVAQTPNADQIPPPPPIDIPEETEAEKQAAEQAASAQAPPPAVTPPAATPPITSTPPPVTSTPPPPITSTPPPVTSTPPPVTSTPPPTGTTPGDTGSGKQDGTEKKTKPVQRAPLTPAELDPATTVAAAYNPFAHDASAFSGDPKQAFDGDPATSWSVALPTPTDVDTPAVGLVIDLGKAQKLRKMTITTTTPGATVEVYGSADPMPPATLDDDGWKHLATQLDVDGGEKTSITLGDDVTGTDKVRQLMIWFAQGPDDGSTSVGISELKLFG